MKKQYLELVKNPKTNRILAYPIKCGTIKEIPEGNKNAGDYLQIVNNVPVTLLKKETIAIFIQD